MVESSVAPAVARTADDSTQGRLEIFVIDSGWNEQAKRVLDEHFTLFEAFLSKHIIYRLNQEQSKLLLEQSPTLTGEDPILVIMDNDARLEKPQGGYGCRLCLGALQPDKLTQHLKKLLQIVSDRSQSKGKILRQLRKEGHKEGFDGAMELVGEIIRL